MTAPFFFVEDHGSHRAVVIFEGPRAQRLLWAFLKGRAGR